MRQLDRRRLVPISIAFLVLAGVFIPVTVLMSVSATTQTQSQLVAMVAAAQTSKEYAYSTVTLASSHGLAVPGVQAQLSQGDSLLATAQADAQSGTDIASGIQSAQAAMSAYTSAATSASVALTEAGFTAYVDYSAAVDEVAEVNATASVVASAAAQACSSAGVTVSGSSGFAQACADVSAQISAARLHLQQAASLLAQVNGQAAAGASLSQAASLTAQARTEVGAAETGLVEVAAHTYSQRGEAYVEAVVTPLSASANATITEEQSFQSSLLQFQSSFDAYVQSQVAAAAAVTASSSTLAADISKVNTDSTSAGITTAEQIAGEVSSNMSALLQISGITSLAGVVADINACDTASTSYISVLASVGTQSSGYAQVQLPSFSAYLDTMASDATSVHDAGSAYVTACQTVVTDLSGLLAIQGVQTIYNNLLNLDFSTSASAVDTILSQETSAMSTVESDIGATTAVFLSSESEILLSGSLVDSAGSISTQGARFFNATAIASLTAATAAVQATALAAQSFVSSANLSLRTSIGAFGASVATLGASGATLNSETNTSVTSLAVAAGYVNSDVLARVSEAALGRAEASEALQLFSSLNVSGGAAAMAQATVDLQAASAVNA